MDKIKEKTRFSPPAFKTCAMLCNNSEHWNFEMKYKFCGHELSSTIEHIELFPPEKAATEFSYWHLN